LTKKHLYKRTIERPDGTSIRAWYYWYYDPITHKQVRKTCGSGNELCLTRRGADAYIARLDEQERIYADIKAKAESVTVVAMAREMFTPGSIYLRFKEAMGEEKSEDTIKNIHRYLRNWIIPKYGNLKIEMLEPAQIQNDLLAIDRSNSWRNRIISIIVNIYEEAVRNKMLRYKPELPQFKKKVLREKNMLSASDVELLFPHDFDSLSRVWYVNGKQPDMGFMFGSFYALMLSTGLRLGEARAINPMQLIVYQGNLITPMISEDGTENALISGDAIYGIIIDRMFNHKEELVRHLKSGNDKNPRWRATLIPNRTVRYIRHWIMIRPRLVPELLFTFHGKKIGSAYAEIRLQAGLKNAHIQTDNRVLTPHSFRFTYNTRMRRLVPGESLRLMIGHTSEVMSDYYTRLAVEEDFLSLLKLHDNVNNFW
jgi:integrase